MLLVAVGLEAVLGVLWVVIMLYLCFACSEASEKELSCIDGLHKKLAELGVAKRWLDCDGESTWAVKRLMAARKHSLSLEKLYSNGVTGGPSAVRAAIQDEVFNTCLLRSYAWRLFELCIRLALLNGGDTDLQFLDLRYVHYV